MGFELLNSLSLLASMLVAYLCVPIASVSKLGVKKERAYSEVVSILEVFAASTAL